MFVKICGVTTEEDALLAVALGADAVGFVFAPSPRQIALQRATEIARRLPPEVLTVGVFRNEQPERVVKIVNTAGLRAAQLHGHEPARDSQWVGERVPVLIKAFSAGDAALDDAADHQADVILLDGRSPGSGQVFDWTLAEGVPDGSRLLLAGGLEPDNVAAAISRVRPWGVDVSTGVEARPGHKDPTKLRRFIVAARSAGDDVDERRLDLRSVERTADGGPYDWQDEIR